MTISKMELYRVTSDDQKVCIAVEENELFNILEVVSPRDLNGEAWPFLSEKEMEDFKMKHDSGCKGLHWGRYHAYINEKGRLWTSEIK